MPRIRRANGQTTWQKSVLFATLNGRATQTKSTANDATKNQMTIRIKRTIRITRPSQKNNAHGGANLSEKQYTS